MSGVETKKLDELFRSLPKNTGVDPRLVEAAKTELNLLKFRAGSSVTTHKQESWTKSDVDKLQTELQGKDTEIYILKQQLLKLREREHHNTRVNDQSDPSAAMKLKDKYTKLFEIEWHEAYGYFRDKGWNDIEIVVTLQRILRASHRFCHDVAAEQLQNIEGEALYPSASWMDDTGILTRMKTKEISQEIKNLAKTYQRSTGQRCLAALQKTFISHVIPTFIDPDRYFEREISVYTKLCVEVTWFMCIQDPPMTFVDKIERGAEFEADVFRKYKNSNGNRFDFLVWPALLLCKGGPLIVKGIAQPIRKKHTIHDEHKYEPDIPHRNMIIASQGSLPYTENTDIDMATRHPDDWVDLNMDEADDPWENSNAYQQAPILNDQNQQREIPTINIIEGTPEGQGEDDLYRGGSSHRSKGKHESSSPYNFDTTGDLTVQWKKTKAKDYRMPSAP